MSILEEKALASIRALILKQEQDQSSTELSFLRDKANNIYSLANFLNTEAGKKYRQLLSPKLLMAINALNKINEISGFSKRFKNLFTLGINHNAERAALEQIAISGLGGIRIGSCMSGKDREGMVTEHVAAQLSFYAKYGNFPPIPPFSKQDKIIFGKYLENLRNEYDTIVAKEFLKGYDQNIAGMNAEGTQGGLKHPEHILGRRIMDKAQEILDKEKKPTTHESKHNKGSKHKKGSKKSKLETIAKQSHKIASLNNPKFQEKSDKQTVENYNEIEKFIQPPPICFHSKLEKHKDNHENKDINKNINANKNPFK